MDEDLACKVASAKKALNESELLRERLRVLDEALAENVVESVELPEPGRPPP